MDRIELGSKHAGIFKGLPPDLAVRQKYCLWFNDFLGPADYDAAVNWTQGNIGAPAGQGIALGQDSLRGELVITPGTADTTGIQAQYTGGSRGFWNYGLTADNNGKVATFVAGIKADVAANGSFILGMIGLDAALISAGGDQAFVNGIYIRSAAGALTGNFRSGSVAGGSLSLGSLSNNRYTHLGVRVAYGERAGNSGDFQGWLEFYRDGALVGKINNPVLKFPTGALLPSIGVVNAAADIIVRMDYFGAMLER